MEIFKNEFEQVTVPPFQKQNSQNRIKAGKLLNLIDDEDYKAEIIKHFGLTSLDFYIQIDNIDTAYKYVEHVHNKYEYVNLWSDNSHVESLFKQEDDEKLQAELFFKFNYLHDDDGVVYDKLEAAIKYDASSMFYNDRELSKYINYLKNKNNKTLFNLNDRNILINDVNSSWKKQYQRNPTSVEERKFRFLKNSKNDYFLRSITSKRYNEYGVAFSFIITMLSLHKVMEKDKGLNLIISSLSINESKIDVLISSGHSVFIEEINQFISSSISIKNNDLGDRSLSFTHSLKMTPLQNEENKIFLFPKFKDNEIKYKVSVSHAAKLKTVLQTFDNISSVIYSVDDYVKDFKGVAKANSPDELRAKIEEKIVNGNTFNKVHKLKDLFTRSTSQHIDNLANLLEICQKAEMIDMDYDLKFRLRYIISNVLLYGKN